MSDDFASFLTIDNLVFFTIGLMSFLRLTQWQIDVYVANVSSKIADKPQSLPEMLQTLIVSEISKIPPRHRNFSPAYWWPDKIANLRWVFQKNKHRKQRLRSIGGGCV